jgi:hypothetical protein
MCDGVRQTAFELHTYSRSGYLEKVYENGLAHRLRKNTPGAERTPAVNKIRAQVMATTVT